MINSIKFRMGSDLSIPIYMDLLKVKSLNVEGDHLIISSIDGIPVDIATAFEELPIGFVIFASQGIEFKSVEQNLEYTSYNAMEFDLYQRSMRIGTADLMKIRDLDSWTYTNGIRVALQLGMKILEDDDGKIGLTISAKNDVASALMARINNVMHDNYSISASDDVDTEQAITNSAQYKTGMHLEGEVQTGRLIDLEDIDNGIIHVTGSDANLIALAKSLQQINCDMGLNASDEVDINVGVSVLQNDSGDVCLVLHTSDGLDMTIAIQPELPSGYTQVEYINSVDGYADTGVSETDAVRAEYTVQVSNVFYAKGNHILSATNTFFPYLSGSNTAGNYSQIRAKLKGSETVATGSSSYTWALNTTYTLEGFVGNGNDVILDGNNMFSITAGNTVSSSSTFLLFATQVNPSDNGYRFHGRLYSMKIYGAGDTLLRNYIPCIDSNNIAGVYDTVTQTFLSSANQNSAFTAGPAV